ncbi:MAG: hypothetical protein M3Q30_24335 [Actinomycetota bacterium]|nr:hypothetical protein [Actinomycetota bacterium]
MTNDTRYSEFRWTKKLISVPNADNAEDPNRARSSRKQFGDLHEAR